MQSPYSYQGALEASERINWRIDDIIGGEKRLDFTKPFMSSAFSSATALSFLEISSGWTMPAMLPA